MTGGSPLIPSCVDKKDAPCKEVILTGDDVDLYKFPWIRNNPDDGGQYISAGCVHHAGPETGQKCGHLPHAGKGPRKTGINFTNQSHGYKFMMDAVERGEDTSSCCSCRRD